jgi:hypothetical protein
MRWRATLWIWALLLGAALILGYHLVRHVTAAGNGTDLYYAGVSLLASAGIAAGIAVHRPGRPAPWVLLAAAQLTYTGGDVAYYVTVATGHDGFPGVADVFYLAQFPLMVGALVVFIRRRTPGWHTATWIDASVLGVAATLLWWVYVISPIAGGSGLGPFALAVTVAYPVLDLLMLATAMRLMLGGGRRPTAFWLLVASLAAMLLGDTVYTINTAQSFWADGGVLDTIWLASYVLGTGSALHPSMRALDARAHVRVPAATARRLAALAAASLLAPIVLLVQYLRHSTGFEPVIALACVLTFLLVLARMAGLVSAQRRTAITDGLTGLPGTAARSSPSWSPTPRTPRWKRSPSGSGCPTVTGRSWSTAVSSCRSRCRSAPRAPPACRPTPSTSSGPPTRRSTRPNAKAATVPGC